MRTIKTNTDGWDCVPELKEVADILEGLREEKYEIDNCVRKTSLNDMVTQLKDQLQKALDELEYIDTGVEYKTVYDYD
jgi:hypothetical protein